MDQAPEPQAASGETPYLRLPWPLVAGGLILLLALALGAGLLANQLLRQQLTVQSPATEVPTPAPSVPTSAPPIAVATTTPQPILIQLTTPTPVATATPVALPATAIPTSVVAAATPTVEPTLAAEVGRAYEAYWRVRAQALLELDSTHLPQVMDGEHLAAVSQTLEQLRSQGKAIKTQVNLNYTVVEANESSAAVFDHIDDDSYYVRAGTDDPLTQPAHDVLTGLFRLSKASGVWKVVKSVGAN